MGCWVRLVALACVVAIAGLTGAKQSAAALDYPTRPVTIIVSYTPQGTTDILARLIGQWLSDRLGQPFAIENRPGDGNNAGTAAAIKSPPDGYTFFVLNPANTINATLYKKLPFDLLRDIAPVAGIVRIPNVMVVNAAVPARTVTEFIVYAKANPGKVVMVSSGIGTSVHLSGALFESMTGVRMQHVPFAGSWPAIAELLGGQAQVMFDNLPSSMSHIRGGALRALGVTTTERSPSLPQVPAIGETVDGYEASGVFGLAAPKGTPREIIDLINKEVNAGLNDPQLKFRLLELGGFPLVASPEEFGSIIANETAKWAKVVKGSGASVE